MTTHARSFGSIVALAVAAAAAVGCSEGRNTFPTGTGGDGRPVPPHPPPGRTTPRPLGNRSSSSGTPPGGDAMIAKGGGFSPFPPQFGSTVSAAVAPPAISGGTLRILADGHTAVAADPDRDRVYVVNLTAR